MSEKITGIVTVVASTGGLKLDDSDLWYNPKGKAKEYVKPELKGKEVTLSLVKDSVTDFEFISTQEARDGSNQGESASVGTKYPANKSVSNQLMIVRQVALKCATKLCVGSIIDQEAIIETADKMTKWVMGE